MLNKAVQSALSIKDSALALLLSQNTLTDDDKLLLRKQLQQWIDTKVGGVCSGVGGLFGDWWFV